MNFGEIKTEVESWLLDLPAGASTRVGGWVNEAVRDAARRYNFRSMESTIAPSPISAAAQTRQLVAKPADWKENRELPYLIHQDGSTTELNWAASESDMVRTYAVQAPSEGNTTPVDEGKPRYLLERPDTIDVYPLPDTTSGWVDGLWRVVVPYWAYPADLVADADTNFFMTDAPYYIIFKAVAFGLKWNRDEERGKFFDAEAEPFFKRIERKDKLSKLPDRMNLGVYKDVYAARPRSGLRS